MKHQLIYSRLFLPRPLRPQQVADVLLRLAADRAAPLVVFESRATESGTAHLLGVPAEHARWVQRTLHDLIPDIEIVGATAADRVPVQTARRLRLRPQVLALATGRPEATSRSVLSALDARLAAEETMVVQILLGPRVAPKHLRGEFPDPAQPVWELLMRGVLTAPNAVRIQAEGRAIEHGYRAVIRLGVSAATPERRQRLTVGLLGALSTAQSPGTYVDLRTERPSRLDQSCVPGHWPLHLAVSELVGLLAWPITISEQDNVDLPGMPPLHPRQLRVPAKVSARERVFAVSAGPGEPRPVGVSASDALYHSVFTGPTGSGKSTALLHLIAADIAGNRPVVVIDPKRQLIDDILDRAVPEERMNDVVLLDPSSERPAGFNPLDVGNRDPDVVVDGLLAVFAAVFKDGWGPRTQDILHSCLLTLARVGAESSEPFTLLDLPKLLTDSKFRLPVIGSRIIADDPGLGQFWAGYQAMTVAAQAQAIAAPLNKLRQYLLRPALRRVLGQPRPTFRIRDVFRERKIVLVPLNEGLIGPLTAQLLGSLVVAEMWQATLERAGEKQPTKRPASVVVDEVQQYLHLPTSIGDALAQSRSYGVAWALAHQARTQLTNEVRAAIDSNARSKIIFLPSDPDDARDFARQAPELAALDFMALPAFHAYANLTAQGHPSGWALIRTLPPLKTTGLGTRVRRTAISTYGQTLPTLSSPTKPTTDASASSSEPEAVGRKRRTRS